MPSLFKYFTIVGGGLLGLLIALDTVMQPGGPGPSLVNVAAPKAVVVKHDPQASRVERLILIVLEGIHWLQPTRVSEPIARRNVMSGGVESRRLRRRATSHTHAFLNMERRLREGKR